MLTSGPGPRQLHKDNTIDNDYRKTICNHELPKQIQALSSCEMRHDRGAPLRPTLGNLNATPGASGYRAQLVWVPVAKPRIK